MGLTSCQSSVPTSSCLAGWPQLPALSKHSPGFPPLHHLLSALTLASHHAQLLQARRGQETGSRTTCHLRFNTFVFLSYCAQEEPLTVGCSHRNLISALTRYIGTWLSYTAQCGSSIEALSRYSGSWDSAKGFGSEVKVMSQVTCTLGEPRNIPGSMDWGAAFGVPSLPPVPISLSLSHTHTHTHTRQHPEENLILRLHGLHLKSFSAFFPKHTFSLSRPSFLDLWLSTLVGSHQNFLMTQEQLTVPSIEGWYYSII